jgi:hypothetical protein
MKLYIVKYSLYTERSFDGSYQTFYDPFRLLDSKHLSAFLLDNYLKSNWPNSKSKKIDLNEFIDYIYLIYDIYDLNKGINEIICQLSKEELEDIILIDFSAVFSMKILTKYKTNIDIIFKIYKVIRKNSQIRYPLENVS